MPEYVGLAVVDKRDGQTIIWHVQTDPAATGILTGAWIADREEGVANLLHGKHVLEVGGQGLAEIHAAIAADVKDLKAAARKAKEKNPSLVAPRFEAPAEPNVDKQVESYGGEPAARAAWAHAVCAARLVDAWHTLESQRRVRKYLTEEFGDEVRPLPLG